MSGKPDSFMPMYWGDYARDTAHLDNAGHGAYLMLIKHCWCSAEPLPDNDRQLSRIACCDGVAEWKKIRPILAKFFLVADGVWRHKRVEIELENARIKYAKRSQAGRTGNAKRWGGDSQTDRNAMPGRVADASQPQPQPPEESLAGKVVTLGGRS